MALIDRLIALARIDERRLELEKKIARAPEAALGEEAKAKQSRDHITKLKEDAKRAILDTKRLEAEAKAKQEEVEKTQIAQNQAKGNEEFKLLGKKIATLKAEIGALELKILEEYERADRRTAELATVEKSQKEVDQHAATERKKADEVLRGLKEELAKVQAERAQAASGIEKEPLAMYRAALERHGDRAVTSVQGQVCGGCFIAIRPNQLSMLKGREQLVTCWQCGRILYLESSAA